MKELQAIIEAVEQIEQCDQTAALATVVKVSGSTYRQPGARMLITSDGQTVGSISGGCLESDVAQKAQRVIATEETIVVQYDTTDETDIVFGVGLGCRGVVHVLIEYIKPLSANSHMAFLAECLHGRQIGAIATVFSIAGQVTTQIGDRLMLQQDGQVTNNIQDPELAVGILEDAGEVLQESRSAVKAYQLANGSAEVLIEAIQPPVPLVVFGAGHDAMPLVRIAKELGWHVTVVDSRPAYATLDRFPVADAVILCRPEALADRVPLSDRTVATVMTHNYLYDLKLLEILLPLPLRYIGMLGPKSRTERLLQALQNEGAINTDQYLSRLYGPVGIDIGADTPEAIALAILAEIQAVLANRSGGFLRDRKGPIHEQKAKWLQPLNSKRAICQLSVL